MRRRCKMSKVIGKCPICGEGDVVKEKHFLSSKIYCTNCNTEFAMHRGKIQIIKFDPDYIGTLNDKIKEALTERIGEAYTWEEWREISAQGYTNEEKIYIQAAGGKLPALQNISSGVILRRGETAYLEESGVVLKEPHSVRTYHGGGRGVSVPVPGIKGVRVRVGDFKGYSESHEELRDKDIGYLLLTNKRLVFSGRNKVSNIKLNKIVEVYPYIDAIKISVENRSKPHYFFVKNSKLWYFAIRGQAQNESS